MARKSGNSVDLNNNEILNFRVQLVAGNPSTPSEARMWYDSTAKRLKFYDGTSVQVLSLADTEAVQDIIGAMVTGNTETGITVTYNDTTGILDFAVTDSPLLGGQNSAYHLSRANHSGTQLASTISNFDTQVRTSRLDQMAAPTAAVAMGSQRITSVADPTGAQDAATKNYVDLAINGLDWKASVRVATTANITLSGTQTIDGVSVVAGNRVLVKDQSTGSGNGIYVVAAGAWSRATDADANAEVTSGLAVFVEEGTANGNQQWVLTTDNPITVGTTSLVFAQIGAAGSAYAAGAGLTSSANTYNVGAGTGITVNADDIAVDPAVVVRKYAQTIGDGTSTAITVTHNLNTRDVMVAIYEASTPYAEWDPPDVTHDTVNAVTLTFATAPTSSQFRVVVHA